MATCDRRSGQAGNYQPAIKARVRGTRLVVRIGTVEVHEILDRRWRVTGFGVSDPVNRQWWTGFRDWWEALAWVHSLDGVSAA